MVLCVFSGSVAEDGETENEYELRKRTGARLESGLRRTIYILITRTAVGRSMTSRVVRRMRGTCSVMVGSTAGAGEGLFWQYLFCR
jgi:hypothetical protein